MASDSEHSDRDESRDAEIGGALRKAVADQFKLDRSLVTLRFIRNLVEEQLKLGDQFLKKDRYWKEESKRIVVEEVDIQDANTVEPSRPEPAKEKSKPNPAARKPKAKKTAKPKKGDDSENGNDDGSDVKPAKKARKTKAKEPKASPKVDSPKKVSSPVSSPKPPKSPKSPKSPKQTKVKSPVKLAKVLKTEVDEIKKPKEEDEEAEVKRKEEQEPKNAVEDSDDDDLSDLDDEPPVAKKKRARSSGTKDAGRGKKQKLAEPKVKVAEEAAEPVEEKTNGDVLMGGDSDLSELEDDPPLKKKKGTRKESAEPKKKVAKGKKATKAKPSGPDLSPDESKIKALQGWLVKCGVRKVWSRELSKCDGPKDKIKHLKKLLEDIGMTGQPSISKAKKIKEERELAAEVEAVQQGAKAWGESSEEEDGEKVNTRSRGPSGGKPGRARISRAHESLSFLDDQSGSD